jgi:glycosyltransferase involved in cell wall biosynthesis
MKVLQLYNQQRSLFGGEESVINVMRSVLERHGHRTSVSMRSSRGIEKSPIRKIAAGASGIFNLSAYYEMRKLAATEQPDVVHVHSVYPSFSPSVLMAFRRERVPTVLHVHSHILTCPNWYHLRKGKVCDLCFGGKEHWCLLTNCRGSVPESAAYALRSVIARRLKLFRNNTTLFVTVSQFLRERLIKAGFPENQIEVLPNAVPSEKSELVSLGGSGTYIGYSGRLSFEKGVDTLVEAARQCGLPLKIAGDGPDMAELRRIAPSNVEFLGRLSGSDLNSFYERSRFLVMPSRSFEGFSMSVTEAMMKGKPVIASRIGALPELIKDGVNGLLVEVDNVGQFADRMSLLWANTQMCRQFGTAARSWAESFCNEELFYQRLMGIYDRARQRSN